MFTNEINKRQEHERPGDYRSRGTLRKEVCPEAVSVSEDYLVGTAW